MAFSHGHKEQGERRRAGARQSGLGASVLRWNPGDQSINRQVVVAGSMPARSIASLLIAMCSISTEYECDRHCAKIFMVLLTDLKQSDRISCF